MHTRSITVGNHRFLWRHSISHFYLTPSRNPLGLPLLQAEKNICEQILEHRRVQNLQVELERRGGRPVSVQEWAVAAGHPSSHQLLEALQEGRKAERTLVICHQALVRSVAARCVPCHAELELELAPLYLYVRCFCIDAISPREPRKCRAKYA